jgi:D-tyrosyl-tRNA(Tyr) deacylase
MPSVATENSHTDGRRLWPLNLVDALIKAMIGLLQRVSDAAVTVDGETVGSIGRGLMVLVAVHRDDTERDIARLAERILSYRVFPDAQGRMNRSLLDEGLGLLLVPQFTLAADTKKGTRASFTKAAPPAKGQDYFERLVTACRERLQAVETGRFGANMQVVLTNDGPVTFWLES